MPAAAGIQPMDPVVASTWKLLGVVPQVENVSGSSPRESETRPVSLKRYGTPMHASMLEFVLATSDMTTEVIADGRHLAPELLRFVATVKGPDRTALVTDCSRALDQPPGMYTFGPLDGGETFYSDGGVGLLPDSVNLASSVRGMDYMVRHMHQQVGLDLPTAVRMATLTPATIIGLQGDIGSLAAGKRADLLFLDTGLNVTSVFVDGEAVTLHRA